MREILSKAQSKNIDVSIVIVNWKTTDKLKECIDSVVDAAKGVRYEAFIIDNASDSKGFDELIHKYSGNRDLKFFKNDKNEGGVVINKIAAKMKGRYLLFLGPDTIMLDSALQKMIKFMDSMSEAGAASAKLLNSDRSPQMYYYKLWDISMVFYIDTILGKVIDKIFFRNRKHKFYLGTNLDVNNVIKIDQPPGVCLIVRPELLLRDGYIIDPLFPFYYNDVDCCKRVWDSGYKIYLLPSAEVIHDHGASFKKANMLWKRREHIKSQIKYFKKYYPKDIKLLKLIRILDFFPRVLAYIIVEKLIKNKLNSPVSVRDIVRNELTIIKDCICGDRYEKI